MAIQARVDTFAASGSTGNQAITSPGFQPDLLLMFGNRRSTTGNAHALMNLGAAKSATERFACSWMSEDNQSVASDSERNIKTDEVISAVGSVGGIVAEADLASMDASGFTINWSNADSLTYNFLTLAGIERAVGTFTLTTGTGNQTVNGLGFTPKAVIFFSACRDTTTGAQADGMLMVGFSDGTNDHCVAVQSEDNQGSNDSDKVAVSDACIIGLTIAGAVDFEASMSSFASGEFTINKSNGPASNTTIGYIALGGDITALVGDETSPTTTGNKTTTTTGVDPVVALFISAAQSTGFGAPSAGATISIGMSDGTRHFCVTDTDENSVGVSNTTSQRESHPIVLYNSVGGLLDRGQFSSFGTEEFVLNWTTVGGTARHFGYLVLGDAPASASHPVNPLGHPLQGPFAGPLVM